MTLIEIIVVYLAVGAPFGAGYYVQHRKHAASRKLLWLGAVGACLLWVFYAAFLLRRKINLFNSEKRRAAESQIEKETERTVQHLLTANSKLIARSNNQSFFEFRETLERYAGLTLAINNSAADNAASKREAEIFLIAKRSKKQTQLGAQLVHRRNFKRLQIHQINARRDLAQFVRGLAKTGDQFNLRELRRDLLNLAAILDDAEAVRLFERALLIEPPKSNRAPHIEKTNQPEPRIWKPKTSPTTAF